MALDVVCPECAASYSLPTSTEGRKIRCKKCQAIFVARNAPELAVVPEQPADEVEEVEEVEAVEEVEEVEEVEVEEIEEVEPARSGVAARAKPRREAVAATPRSAAGVSEEDEEDEEDEDEEEARGGGGALLLVGLLVVGGLLLIGGGVGAFFLLRESPAEDPPALAAGTPTTRPPAPRPKPPTPRPKPPVPPVVPPVTPPDKPTPPTPPTRPGELSPEALRKVKQATVYLRVTYTDDTEGLGTGFFGAAHDPNIILTNAHVVGMLSPASPAPRKIEVLLNHGQKDERKVGARVLGVDRSADLAVLDVGRAPSLPEPLTVKSADEIRELQKVFIFGFPLGDKIGKEITVRDSTVSSLRRVDGRLHRIQVNGGMDEGNSGGPVVDDQGHVIGVAVSGFSGRQINFAIPAEFIGPILRGRVSEVDLDWPVAKGDRIGAPVTLTVIDPRRRIAEVSVEAWAGPRGSGTRPPAEAKPAPDPGDTPHQRVALRYDPLSGEATGDLLFPAAGPGQALWVRPVWKYRTGEERWAEASVYTPANPPLTQAPAELNARFRTGALATVTLSVENQLRVGSAEDFEVGSLRVQARLKENIARGNVREATFQYTYDDAHRTLTKGDRTEKDRLFQEVEPFLQRYLLPVLITDALGNPKQNVVNLTTLRRMPNAQEQGPKLLLVHAPIQAALSTTAVPLPNKEVKVGDSWKGERFLPIPSPEKDQIGKVLLTYTYLGKQNVEGREQAVLDVTGKVEGVVKASELSGRARGKVIVDLMTGRILRTDLKVNVNTNANLSDFGGPKKIRVLATLKIVLRRGM